MISSRSIRVVQAVNWVKEGARTCSWVQARKWGGDDRGGERKVRGRAEFAAVVGAITAEEDKGRWRGGGAGEGTHVTNGMLASKVQ